MTNRGSAVSAMQAPKVQIGVKDGSEVGWIIDVREDADDAQLKVVTHSGQIRSISLLELATQGPKPQQPTAQERQNLEFAIRQQIDVEEVMKHATQRARERAALLGWLVGITTTGFPINVPGCPALCLNSGQLNSEQSSIADAIELSVELINWDTGKTLLDGVRISDKTLYRKRTQYKTRGLKALTHQGQGSGRLDKKHEAPRIREFVFEIAEKQSKDVKISRANFILLIIAAARREGVALIPERAHDRRRSLDGRLLRKYATEAHANWQLGRARSKRESRAISSRSAAPSVQREAVPFASIEIDATQHDAFCLDENGQKCNYVEKLSAYCSASGSFIDCMFIVGHAKARDVVHFIIQLMLRTTNRTGKHLLAPGRLRTVRLGLTKTDRGANMIAIEAMKQLSAIGIEVVVAAPSRGDQKGRVESGQRRQNQSAQLAPGYFGSTQREAPAFDYSRQYLPVAAAERYEKAIGELVYNRMPKASLRVPGFKVPISPQMYVDAFENVIPIPDQPFPSGLIKKALEKRSGVMTSSALQYQGEQYVLPEGATKPILPSYTKTPSGHQVTFYPIGRRPEFLILETPGAHGEMIDSILLRRDVVRREMGADISNVLSQGLDLEELVEQSRRSKDAAEDSLISLAEMVHAQAETPSRPGHFMPEREPHPAIPADESCDADDYVPTPLKTSQDWIQQAEEFVMSRARRLGTGV